MTDQPDSRDDAAERMRTPLLALITAEALERDYQMVARRRIASGTPRPLGRSRWSGRIGVVSVVAVFGALVTVAGAQASRDADIDTASRETLIDRIETGRALVQAQQGQISDLREEIAEGDEGLRRLGSAVSDAEGRADQLGGVTGFTPVTGEGIDIRLDNAPYADPDTEHIRDSDLALLVNALWTAGAEAVAINNQRLSLRSPIRNSGRAIEVNSIGIAPPYLVEVVGNKDTLSANLLETSSGAAFSVLAADYGWSYEVDNVDELRLPAAPPRLRNLRSATEITESGPVPDEGGE
ncbi:DUF881 domain-containing protein [Nocardioides stalactiti]|uniref:DUF881 domain-containing protein n=1 Tax=Nocardioides stalactiti TaxID=2755356 RepID=UPI0016029AD9|nr:DUF881 domain-containing protein [Nocardioides stalactiti]